MRILILAAVAALGLSACATYDLSTPEGQAAYQRDLAISQRIRDQSEQFLSQQTQVLQSQATQTPTPQVLNPAQPNSTAIVYCRDLTGALIACKQIN